MGRALFVFPIDRYLTSKGFSTSLEQLQSPRCLFAHLEHREQLEAVFWLFKRHE